MAKQNYIHVSFDEVQKFVLRIPKIVADGEDTTIPRISVCDSIDNALYGMSEGERVMEGIECLHLTPIIHAYYLTPDKNGVLDTKAISKYVPDAQETGEMWLTKPPVKVERIDYKILFFVHGQPEIMQVNPTDGIETFLNDLGVSKNRKEWHQIIKDMGFRHFLSEVNEEVLNFMADRHIYPRWSSSKKRGD